MTLTKVKGTMTAIHLVQSHRCLRQLTSMIDVDTFVSTKIQLASMLADLSSSVEKYEDVKGNSQTLTGTIPSLAIAVSSRISSSFSADCWTGGSHPL